MTLTLTAPTALLPLVTDAQGIKALHGDFPQHQTLAVALLDGLFYGGIFDTVAEANTAIDKVAAAFPAAGTAVFPPEVVG